MHCKFERDVRSKKMCDKGNEETSLQYKLFDYTFNVQKLVGYHPHQKKWYKMVTSFNFFTHLVCMGLVIYMICCNLNDIDNLLVGIDGFIAQMQAALKYLPFILHRKEMGILINGLQNFGRIKNADVYKFWIKITQLNFMFVFIVLFVLMTYPGFLFKLYIPDFPHSFIIMLVHQKMQFAYSAVIVLGIDTFYLALFVTIKLEYQKLKEDLELLQASANKQESLKFWIDQHIFLTEYTKCFAATFSEASLLQYVAATVNLCTELYFLRQTKSGGVFNILYVIELFLQISLLCLTADEITNRALDLADALYSMQWYDFSHKEMKMLPLLIQQAQTPVTFVAGGLIDINKPAIKTILQNAYAFYALANQMNQN